MRRTRTKLMDQILARAGGVRALARQLGISAQSVSKWHRVPVYHVKNVELITGLDKKKIRPDVYD